jgi:curved DNA-binding protein
MAVVLVGAIIQIFESMFGGRSARGAAVVVLRIKGQDFNAELHLDLKMFTLLIKHAKH